MPTEPLPEHPLGFPVRHVGRNLMIIEATCELCGKPCTVYVPEANYRAWRAGALIQNAFPAATPGYREKVLSGTHEACFDAAYAEDDG